MRDRIDNLSKLKAKNELFAQKKWGDFKTAGSLEHDVATYENYILG
jgi:hypothetical protein